MSFYISLSGLKGAQADLTTISNNVANVGSTAFKKSTAEFGDIFVGQSDGQGQGVRTLGSQQQFTQGTLETTDKTLDLAITGDGFFTVRTAAGDVAYTRNGSFGMDQNRNVVDSTGANVQVLPTPPNGDGTPTGTSAADLKNLTVPTLKMDHTVSPEVPVSPQVELSSISVNTKGVVAATYADGTTENLGVVAMATFPNQEGLRQLGDAHWTPSGKSGQATYGAGDQGQFGQVRSGMLERSNVDITEELVALIAAQRNFQANAKAIDAANQLTTTITNLRN
ncbi:MAG TPA: flagellar hook basal-body protein [Sphingobium sp.]|uniref:flagellar hook basal-body protein n=1 Tax=Sphingobium sp. TaxID=1912891 RepID=UPI002ED18E5B